MCNLITASAPGADVETNVGYAWLSLMHSNDRLIIDNDVQEFVLPVAATLSDYYTQVQQPAGPQTAVCVTIFEHVYLNIHYFYAATMVSPKPPDIRWVDNGRPLFRVRLRLVSSI